MGIRHMGMRLSIIQGNEKQEILFTTHIPPPPPHPPPTPLSVILSIKGIKTEDVSLVQFMHFVFTRMPGESYSRRVFVVFI